MHTAEDLKKVGTVMCRVCMPEEMTPFIFRSGYVSDECNTCKTATDHCAVDVDAFAKGFKEHVLIPKDLVKDLEIGALVQYGDVSCIIIGATVGYAIGGKLTMKPTMSAPVVGNGETLGKPVRTPAEIIGDIPQGFIPMYGPLIVAVVRSNTGKAEVRVWQYAPVERLTAEFDSPGEAEQEAARVLYILEKHGVKVSRPVGKR